MEKEDIDRQRKGDKAYQATPCEAAQRQNLRGQIYPFMGHFARQYPPSMRKYWTNRGVTDRAFVPGQPWIQRRPIRRSATPIRSIFRDAFLGANSPTSTLTVSGRRWSGLPKAIARELQAL